MAQVPRLDMDKLPPREDPRPRLYVCTSPNRPPIELDFKNDVYRLAGQTGPFKQSGLYFTLTTKLGYRMAFDFGFTFEINYGSPAARFSGTFTVDKGERTTAPAPITCIRKA